MALSYGPVAVGDIRAVKASIMLPILSLFSRTPGGEDWEEELAKAEYLAKRGSTKIRPAIIMGSKGQGDTEVLLMASYSGHDADELPGVYHWYMVPVLSTEVSKDIQDERRRHPTWITTTPDWPNGPQWILALNYTLPDDIEVGPRYRPPQSQTATYCVSGPVRADLRNIRQYKMAAWRKLGEEDWKAAMDDFWIHRLARVEVYGTERSVSVASMNISHVELTEAQQEARTRFRERARDVLDSMKSPSADLLSHMSLVPNSLSRTAPTPDLLSRMEPPPDLLSRMSMPAALPSLPQKRSRLRYNDLEDVPRGDPDDDAMSWKQASYADESELPAPKRRKIDSPLPPARSRGSVKSFRGQRGRRTSYATSLSRMSVDVAPASNATGLDRVAERPATLSALTHSNYGGLVEMRSPGPSRVSNADHTSPRRLTEHSVSPSVRYDDSLLASGPLQSISTHATTPSPPHNDITIPSVDAPEGPMGQPSSDSPTQSPKMLRIRGAASSTP